MKFISAALILLLTLALWQMANGYFTSLADIIFILTIFTLASLYALYIRKKYRRADDAARRRIKRIIKYAFIIAALILLIPAAKNSWLLLKYNHNIKTMTRVSGASYLAGTWRMDFTTHQCGPESRHRYLLTLLTDTSGYLLSRHDFNKIDGYMAHILSWRSLLPFNNDDALKELHTVYITDNQFIFLPVNEENTKKRHIISYKYNDTEWTPVTPSYDTLIFDYKYTNDSLYISDNYGGRYNRGEWGMEFNNWDLNYLALINPWENLKEWLYLFREINTYYI